MTTLHLRKSIGPATAGLGLPRVQPIWIIRGFLLIPLVLACFALSQTARAALPPPAPDGGYPNFNTAEGTNALLNLTTGVNNTASGYAALDFNTTGSDNTANGLQALGFNTTGNYNTATGSNALTSNTTGHDNTANGYFALRGPGGIPATGSGNTATGSQALTSNTTGFQNTANGYQALTSSTTGTYNTATGALALTSDTGGDYNTANGTFALTSNTTASFNTATGYQALTSNTTGGYNTATGLGALQSNTTASFNTATGYDALYYNTTGTQNTANGLNALNKNTTGSNNIAFGVNAGLNLTTGNNNIDIGNAGVAGEAAKIRIGKQGTQNGTFIAGIFGVTMTGSPVVVNSSGKLGVSGTSSIRFKKAVKPMDNASEAVLALKPVTFRYKEEIDPEGTPQFGLVAEEVEKVNPDLITRDEKGKPTTVRYDAVNAMLLNEFLKEHRKVEQQDARLAKQEAMIAQQQKQIETLTATVRKVSERVELSAPALPIAANND
jgi:hypothetical protein